MAKGKNLKISKVKRSNQKRIKLSKQGKLKTKRNRKLEVKHKPAKPVKEQEYEDEESDQGEDFLEMVEDDDLAYLKNAISQQSYQLLKSIRSPEPRERGPKRQKSKNEDDELAELENKYENDSEVPPSSKRTRVMLPIKTSKGIVTRVIEEDERDAMLREEAMNKKKVDKKQEKKDSDDDDDEEDDDESEEDEAEITEAQNSKLDTTAPVTTAQLLACRQEVLSHRKFRIGILASGILENPEGRMKNFKPLLDMMDENTPEVKITVRKLATISLFEVFKDILPSYYIKFLDLDGVILKKSTLELRKFEQELLKSYKTYLTKLEKLASTVMRKKGDSRKFADQELRLGEVAVECMANLLVAHPNFNFSVNLAQFLVTFLDNHSPRVREIALKSLQQVFKEDKRGEISLEIVRRINNLVKKREHDVHSEVLQVLLVLRIKDVNLDKEKEDELQQKKMKGRKMKLLTMSKMERKREKKLKELESELQETKAEESKQKKHQHLTEITKVVFMIYFRVLKKEPNTKILSVTLEGLAKFAHCINLDFYHDLVNVLDDLMESGDLNYRNQLHIVQTVFTILSGQGEMLTIDPCRFYSHLYRNLLAITAGTSHPDMIILVKSLEVMLIRRRKKISQQRLLAFTKRLATLALQLLHHGSLACLGHIKSVLQLHKSADVLLDVDKSGGQGVYLPFLEEPEYCNAANSALWEVALLQRHYHPTVRKFANLVSAGAPVSGNGSLPLDLAKLSAEDLFNGYDCSKGAFRPAIPAPKKLEAKLKPTKVHICNQILLREIENVMNSSIPENLDFSKALVK